MIRQLVFGALTLWLGSARPLTGQSTSTGVASLEVSVTDTVSGRPVLRILLWSWRSTGPRKSSLYYARADTAGQLRMDSIPAGVPQRFQVVCEHYSMRNKHLDSLTITFTAGEVRRWQVLTSSSGCDQRPFVVHRGVFEGRWRYGFEESRFLPCDSLLPEAWVTFAPSAKEEPGLRWPRNLDKYYPEVFVRFEGLLVGPWRYGHLGVSDYQLTVSRTVEARKPSPARCGRS